MHSSRQDTTMFAKVDDVLATMELILSWLDDNKLSQAAIAQNDAIERLRQAKTSKSVSTD